MPTTDADEAQGAGSGVSATARAVAAVVFAVAVAAAYYFFRDEISLEALAAREQQLRRWQQTDPVLVYAVAFGVYVCVTGLSLPGATPLSLVYGWLLGLVPGVILISFASTSGATVAFLLSRYLFRDAIERRFGKRLARIQEAFRREGVYYLLTARLIPGIPFVVINLVMGLTSLRVWTFWWVSQLGMLPATILYVWAGDSFPDLRTLSERGASSVLTPELIAALVCLGVFPLAARYVMTRLRRGR